MTEEESEAFMQAYRKGLATALMAQMIPTMIFHTGKHMMEFKPGSIEKMAERLEKFVETGE